MKILYHHRIASKDGQYVHVEELTVALRRLGHELLIVGPDVSEKGQFGSEGGWLINALKRSLPKPLYEFLEFGYSIVAFVRLLRAARRFKPDVLYERYNLFMPAGVWLKRHLQLPMLLEVNAPLFEERCRYGGIALRRLARWSEEYVWRGADRVLPVTRVMGGYVERVGVPPEHIVVIPNGVDPERFKAVENIDDAKKRLGLSGKLVLGFTGFVREWDEVERAVDLLSTGGEQERHLLIVGTGPGRENLLARARKLGVEDKLTITGLVPRNEVASYIAAFDIALWPGDVPHSSPLKLFEYLAMAKPIVAPDSPNIREILTDGVDAILFDVTGKSAFAEAIERLCNDTALRLRIAQGAGGTIDRLSLTWDNNAKRVIALAQSLLKK